MKRVSADAQPSRSEVHCTWIEVRGASRADPGEIALIHYVMDGAMVVLTDAQGQHRKDGDGGPLTARISHGEYSMMTAKRLARRSTRGTLERRERPLLYEKVVIV